MAQDPQARAESIRAALARAIDTARNNRQLSAEGIRLAMARAYVQALDDMKALREELIDGVNGERDRLERDVFNLNAITPSAAFDPIARSTALIAYRDAQDRVQQIIDDRDSEGRTHDRLLALLDRAQTAGDEFMARAVAEAAYRAQDIDLLNAFTATHPSLESTLQRLVDLNGAQRRRDDFAFHMTYRVDAPSELTGIPEYEIRAMAGGGRRAAGA